MALLLDSVDLDEIAAAMELGIFSGVTTNPKLLAGVARRDQLDHLGAVARIGHGSLYMQVEHGPAEAMEEQALTLQEVAPGRCVIKVPISQEGLVLCQRLRAHRLPVCMTAIFSPLQAVAAGAAGARAAAVYAGRLARSGEDGPAVVADCARVLAGHGQTTRVIAASIADAQMLLALLRVPDIDLTLPGRLLPALLQHAGTTAALAEFAEADRAARALGDEPSDAGDVMRLLGDDGE